MRKGSAAFLVIAGLAGLGLAVWIYVSYDFAEVMDAFGAVGWAILLILAWRCVPLGLDAAGWRRVLPPERRPPFLTCWWVRWVSESVNALLPVAQIGGEVVRSRLISRRSVVPDPDLSGGEAGGSVVVDVTLGTIATAVFSLAGVLLLVNLSTGQAVNQALWGVAGLFLLLALLGLAQRFGWLGRGARWITAKMSGELADKVGGGSRDFDRTIGEAWRNPGRLAKALGWRVAGSFATAGEIWLALAFQGVEVSLADVVVLESITYAVRTAAFVVPGGLGLQEGTLLLLGQLMGLPPQVSLSVALIKRVRELAVGTPALALWWWIEGRIVSR